ncbi:hypothetical protein B7494_g5888 [Chlorociboria aeruginascens]|nr:hypothetical protein B7494_g5888 [Chlorociboria aeruginascens]
MATNGSFNQQDQYKSSTEQYPPTSGPTDATSGSATGNGDLSKDEVGWYFVEQYYTTLSKSPEKLHLFYGKHSQFVSGLEAEVTPVSVGRAAIQERIRKLDFQDCKVRVSNVDSQSSFDNIVIQVIGETSNKSAELKKFVQTFVLAQQPTGYFVLNDIFRYINEEDEEEQIDTGVTQDDGPTGPLVDDVEMPKAQVAVEEALAPLDVGVVDQKLEDVIEPEPAAASTNGITEEVVEAEHAPVTAVKQEEEEIPTPEAAEKAVAEEDLKQMEQPQSAVPTPNLQAPSKPAQPAAPAKPLSWAARLGAVASGPKPAVPVTGPKVATPPAQSRATPPAQPKAVQLNPTPAAPLDKNEKENEHPDGWQTAGADHTKRQNRQQSISSPLEKEGTMGYVKNVTDKVSAEGLHAALSTFGELVYFDINRSKNCAFVEYSTPSGYQAAAAANPHQIADETIYVEPRRPRANAYGGNAYNGGRGGLNNRGGRGGFEQQNRSPNQGGPRGNFGGQNRGQRGGGASRGRGSSQPTPTNA